MTRRMVGYIPMKYRYTPSTLTVYERGMWWVLPVPSERTRKHRMRARRLAPKPSWADLRTFAERGLAAQGG